MSKRALIIGFVLPFTWSFARADPTLESFVRGDINQNERLEITDAVLILQHLFRGHEQAANCLDAADVDDDGSVTITDGVVLLGYLFQRGRPPFPPRECGPDLRGDDLDCVRYEPCVPTEPYFYGRLLSADDFDDVAVYFLVDRSASWSQGGEFEIAKREILTALCALPESAEFGVVFADQGIVRFPEGDVPASATAENIDDAAAVITAIGLGRGSCPLSGFLTALDFAEASSRGTQLVYYVGDGGTTCPGHNAAEYAARTVAEVTDRNAGLAAIHTIGVGVPLSAQQDFLERLAELNGGTSFFIVR